METEKRNDEIDLIEVFLKMYIFFKKNFWVLFISVIIGAGLGYSIKFLSEKHYESSMLINSDTVSEDLLIEYINNIQTIIEDGNFQYLSDKMEIDSLYLINLKGISVEEVYDEKEKKSKEYLSVTANVIDNQLLASLSTGILKFLEKEPYIQNEIEIFNENNLSIISKIDEELEKLEILQDNNLNQSRGKGDVNIYNSQNSFQDELLKLLKEKQSKEKMLKFATPFRVIQDFTIYQKPETNTKTYTLIGGLLFGFLALTLLIIRNINKSIKENQS